MVIKDFEKILHQSSLHFLWWSSLNCSEGRCWEGFCRWWREYWAALYTLGGRTAQQLSRSFLCALPHLWGRGILPNSAAGLVCVQVTDSDPTKQNSLLDRLVNQTKSLELHFLMSSSESNMDSSQPKRTHWHNHSLKIRLKGLIRRTRTDQMSVLPSAMILWCDQNGSLHTLCCREPSFGHGILTLENNHSALWQWHRNQV